MDVGQTEGGQEDTWRKTRVHHAMVETSMCYPSQGGESAVVSEDVGDNPDKAHDDQTLEGCGEEDEAGGDERAVGEGNDARDALRGVKVGGAAVVAVVGVATAVGDDEATVVVAVVAAELAVAAVAYA